MSLAFDFLIIVILLSVAAAFFAGAFFLLQLVFDRFFTISLPILATVYLSIKNPDKLLDK